MAGQVNPIKNTKYLKPQEHWGWPIAVYLYLAGMGAGSFIIGIMWDWLGYSLYPSNAILLCGIILVPIGALFLILDLGTKSRFMNAVRNPRTSWLSRGFLILSAYIAFGTVTLILSFLPLVGITVLPSLFLALEAIGLIFAFLTAIYTGILLQSLKYIPFWNTALLPILFLISALSTGSMLVILLILVTRLFTPQAAYTSHPIDMLTRTEQILVFIVAFILGLFLLLRYRVNEQGKSSVHLLLSGSSKFGFWTGIVLLGFFFPIVLEAIYSGVLKSAYLLLVIGISLLVGGFLLRFLVISAGIKQQIPMHRLTELKYNLRVLKKKR